MIKILGRNFLKMTIIYASKLKKMLIQKILLLIFIKKRFLRLNYNFYASDSCQKKTIHSD